MRSSASSDTPSKQANPSSPSSAPTTASTTTFTKYYHWRVDRITCRTAAIGLLCYFRDVSEQMTGCGLESLPGRHRRLGRRRDHLEESRRNHSVVQCRRGAVVRLFVRRAGRQAGPYADSGRRQSEEDDILARLRRGERIEHFETVRVAKDGRPHRDLADDLAGARRRPARSSARRRSRATSRRSSRRRPSGCDWSGKRRGHRDAEQRRRDRRVRPRSRQGRAGGHRRGDGADDGRIRRVLLQRGRTRRRVVHALHDLGRAARGVLEVPDAAQHRRLRADVQGHRRGSQRRHHEGSAIRPQRAAPRHAGGAPAGAQLSRRAGEGRGRARSSAGCSSATRRSDRFTEHHERLAVGVASWASVALENARMYASVQEASRIKDEFLASLSHELRTPLNAILGYARMLRSGIVAPDRSGQGDRDDRAQRHVADADRRGRARHLAHRVGQDPTERSAGGFPGDRAERRSMPSRLPPRRRACGSRRCSIRDAAPVSGDPGAAAAGAVEPAVERGQVHQPRRPGSGAARAASTRTSKWRSATRVSGSRRSSFRTCSSVFGRRTRASRANAAGSAWACRLPAS